MAEQTIAGYDDTTFSLRLNRSGGCYKYKAPKFWAEFYQQKFKLSPSLSEMYKWGELVGTIKFALSEATVQLLRNVYKEERYWMNKF